MTNDVFLVGLNALENSSRVPVSRADVIKILKSGDGPGNLVRALFEDCSLEALDVMGAAIGLSPRQIRASYDIARRKHGAANPEFEHDDP